MISSIVAEEVRKQLPEIATRVITETFLRRIVAESAANGRPAPARRSGSSLAEVLGDESDDEAPGPMKNNDDGIYQQSPLVKEEKERARALIRSRLLEEGNPMASLYEGTRPISANPMASTDDGPGIPIEKMGVDPAAMRKLAGMTPRQPVTEDRKMKELDLERRRKALDVPVSEWRGQ